jgi:hypothetical protein
VVADRGEDLPCRLSLVDQFAREELLFIGGTHLLIADVETISTGQRSSKRIRGGGGSWGRLAALARFGRSIRAGGAPIYRGEPIYS